MFILQPLTAITQSRNHAIRIGWGFNMKTVRAWHFVSKTLRDGRPIPKNGVWLKHTGQVKICDYGLHASIQAFDAMRYAPGPNLCLVDCRDIVASGLDKFVCRERRIVCRFDATEMLFYFARQQALSVIDLWVTEPHGAVLDYLMTGDESIRAAAGAAARQSFNNLVNECFGIEVQS